MEVDNFPPTSTNNIYKHMFAGGILVARQKLKSPPINFTYRSLKWWLSSSVRCEYAAIVPNCHSTTGKFP